MGLKEPVRVGQHCEIRFAIQPLFNMFLGTESQINPIAIFKEHKKEPAMF